MTYTASQRARYVGLRIEEAQQIVQDAVREAARMNGTGDELRASLRLLTDQLADARAEAKDLQDAGRD